jgi:hypothetical protein
VGYRKIVTSHRAERQTFATEICGFIVFVPGQEEEFLAAGGPAREEVFIAAGQGESADRQRRGRESMSMFRWQAR